MNKGKSKTTAVLLAVFLGPCTWVYTASRDWRKFLIGIVLCIVASIFLVLGELIIWLLHYQLDNPQFAWEFGLVLSGILLAAMYLWAIVDTAKKPASWYDEYGSK